MDQYLARAEYIKIMAQALSCNIYVCNSHELSKEYEEAATQLLGAAKESIQLLRKELQSDLDTDGFQKKDSID